MSGVQRIKKKNVTICIFVGKGKLFSCAVNESVLIKGGQTMPTYLSHPSFTLKVKYVQGQKVRCPCLAGVGQKSLRLIV